MTVQELIDALEKAKDSRGGDADVEFCLDGTCCWCNKSTALRVDYVEVRECEYDVLIYGEEEKDDAP